MSRQSNRLQLHRHAVHGFEDLLDVLKRYNIDMRDSRVSSALHHFRHAVWRSGKEVPVPLAYIEQGQTEIEYVGG